METNIIHRTLRGCFIALLSVIMMGGVQAAEESQRKRGGFFGRGKDEPAKPEVVASAEEVAKEVAAKKRRSLSPFKGKRTDKKAEKAVEDMREFTQGLPGQSPKPAPAVSKPAPATPKPAAPSVATVELPKVEKPKAEPKKRRRLLSFGEKDDVQPKKEVVKPAPGVIKPELPKPQEVAAVIPKKEKKGRSQEKKSRSLLRPFDKKLTPEKPEVKKPEPSVIAKVIPNAKPEKKSEPAGTPKKRLFSFGGNKEEKKAAASAPEVVVSQPKKKPLDSLSLPKFPEKKEKAPPTPKVKDKEKKRGSMFAFGRSDADKPEKPAAKPSPTSSRDLGVGEKYIITVDRTPFYSIGPTQPLPPDEILTDGTMVTMRKSGWGWSDIEISGGQIGVVATKNLRKATAKELRPVIVSRPSSNTRSLWKVMDFNPAPEPELPSDSGGLPLGAGLLPPLDPDE